MLMPVPVWCQCQESEISSAGALSTRLHGRADGAVGRLLTPPPRPIISRHYRPRGNRLSKSHENNLRPIIGEVNARGETSRMPRRPCAGAAVWRHQRVAGSSRDRGSNSLKAFRLYLNTLDLFTNLISFHYPKILMFCVYRAIFRRGFKFY